MATTYDVTKIEAGEAKDHPQYDASRVEAAAKLREEADECMRRKEESFQRCDTDGFLSQWANGITARKQEAQARIEENGGLALFQGLFTLDGERVRAKLIDGRYGTCWAICDERGNFTGEFVSAFPKRETTMYRKGYQEAEEWAPAAAIIAGEGTGLSGCASAYVRNHRKDGGYPGAKDARNGQQQDV